eukprot:GSChrysophyteH2.ASY1.ANO1.186.1 assembled CDS
MDEADQLLDMGFKPDIDRILALLPSPNTRQTLLFSATVPHAVRDIANKSLRSGWGLIDTVGEEVEQTHSHQITTLAQVLNQEIASCINASTGSNNYKIIVFFTTARMTQFYSQIFNLMDPTVLHGSKVFEMHSRKSQSSRTSTSNQFRDCRNAIMFSSDVSARGLDYPDVTYVLQVGLTDRQQYIHRLGRTARAGKSGHGALMLAPYEEKYMKRSLNDMPLINAHIVPTSNIVAAVSRCLGAVDSNTELKQSAQQAYGAWLGYYNSNLRNCGWDKATLVVFANAMASFFGLRQQV